jgi:hypothetical protein
MNPLTTARPLTLLLPAGLSPASVARETRAPRVSGQGHHHQGDDHGLRQRVRKRCRIGDARHEVQPGHGPRQRRCRPGRGAGCRRCPAGHQGRGTGRGDPDRREGLIRIDRGCHDGDRGQNVLSRYASGPCATPRIEAERTGKGRLQTKKTNGDSCHGGSEP